MATLPPNAFFEEGRTTHRCRRKDTKHKKALHKELDMFRAFFGTYPFICSQLWERIDPRATLHPESLACHLLWALFVMHNCCTETLSASFLGVDEDTLRKWAMPWVPATAELTSELVDFDMRFQGNWHHWMFCVDGVHCPIQ